MTVARRGKLKSSPCREERKLKSNEDKYKLKSNDRGEKRQTFILLATDQNGENRPTNYTECIEKKLGVQC